jgi:hypothetical protein
MATHTPLMAAQEERDPCPLDAVIAIAAERSGYLTGIKSALESGNDTNLKYFARKLCGMAVPASIQTTS